MATPTREHAEPFVLGLAGGVGSGKSYVARALGSLGCLVIDFDREATACFDRPEVRDELVRWWGEQVLAPGGGVDRNHVARIVFADEAERRRLESLIHPLVWVTREQARARGADHGAPGVVFDAPLLFESGLDRECDHVLFVDADEATRLRRAATRPGWDEAEWRRREGAQMAPPDKRARCRFVVWNAGEDAGSGDSGSLRARLGSIVDILSGGSRERP